MSRETDRAFDQIASLLADLKADRDDLEHERDVLLAEKASLESEVEALRADLLEARQPKGAA
jgi:multidrug resistance efflux pump